MQIAKITPILAIVTLLLSPTTQAHTDNLLTTQQWRDDLHYLADQIVKIHPDAFHSVRAVAFQSAVNDLDTKIPSLSDHQIEVEMIRLVAMLGEGHSRLSMPGLADPMSDVSDITPFKDDRLAFHSLPIRLYSFSDGLFVVAATPEFHSLVGARVIKIGGRPAPDVLDTLQPLVNRDNDMGTALIAPVLAMAPEILEATGIATSSTQVPVELRRPDGETISVNLSPQASGAIPPQIEVSSGSPRYLQNPEKNFWVESFAESKTVYAKINVIQDGGAQSIATFAHDIEAATGSGGGTLVVDFRGCHGGDNQKFRSILLAILRNTKINQLGRLFVITDRATFSAAVNAAADLERLSNAIFVGEPTAGSPASWGDPAKVTLPNSGLAARISRLYWSDWMPTASRKWIAPDIATPLTSADYFSGRDPALAAMLRFPQSGTFGDVVEALIAAGAGLDTVERLYYQHKTDPLLASSSTEQPMQRIGAILLERKRYNDALLIFEINYHDYPRSISSALQIARSTQKTAQRNDDLDNLVAALERLNAKH